ALNETNTAASTYSTVANTANSYRITDGTNAYLTLDTRTTNSGSSAFTLTPGTAPTIASGASVQYTTATLTPGTTNFTGTTNITGTGTGAGNIGLLINQPTISTNNGSGNETITEADTALINGPSIATDSNSAGIGAITNSAALRILAGSTLAGSHGAVTNGYGLYVDAPTGATNNYAVYVNTGNVNIQSLSASQGVYTDANKNLTSTIPSSGNLGFWNRTGTTLSPTNSGDAITTSGNISTSSSGTITSAGLLTGQAGLTVTGAAVSLNASSNFNTSINTGTSTGSVTIGNSLAGAINLTTNAASTFAFKPNTASSLVINDQTNPYLTLDTRTTTSGVSAFTFATGTAPTIASAASAAYNSSTFTPGTVTYSGTTSITGTGTSANNAILFNQPTLQNNNASGLTITQASNLFINGADIATDSAAGTETITNSAALKIGAGSALNGTNGAVTNGYGLYVDAPTGATNNYAVYVNTGNVNIQNLSASQGVYTDANKNLTSTIPSSGNLGFWNRTGTTLSPT
ncbi:MAG TPA: hypothetical protein VM782_19690, partial [Stellaceae bacterium]|nr:hypothetical protein [Stellaceae bacterium]